jgi:hypothetical protein
MVPFPEPGLDEHTMCVSCGLTRPVVTLLTSMVRYLQCPHCSHRWQIIASAPSSVGR